MSEPTIDTPQAEPAAPTPADMPGQRAEAPVEESKSVSGEELDKVLRKLRDENHSLRTKLRETEPLAKKAQAAEEANKTEIQKAVERAQAAENAKTELETGYTRLELAVQYSIPPDDIDLIGSGTRDEMDVRAQRLAALNAAASKATPPPSDRPVEGLRPGASPEPAKEPDDSYPAAWVPSWLKDNDNRSQHGQ